ncbi:Spore maturation protein B [Legionella maceachernii]|nr:hypothetical protein [Legionella maceachernii]SUP04922.1 Spore maturation protein B [Legionella maceachernii]
MSNFADHFSNWIFLAFIVGIPLYGALKKINVFDAFVTGAKQGFETSISIIPYLIAMLVAIGMLRASGFFELMQTLLSPALSALGMPSELLPLALIRPFQAVLQRGLWLS